MANLFLHAVNLGHTACVLLVKLFKSLSKPVAITRYPISDAFVKLEFGDRPSVLRHDLSGNVSDVPLDQPNSNVVFHGSLAPKDLNLSYSYLKLCPSLFIAVLVIYHCHVDELIYRRLDIRTKPNKLDRDVTPFIKFRQQRVRKCGFT